MAPGKRTGHKKGSKSLDSALKQLSSEKRSAKSSEKSTPPNPPGTPKQNSDTMRLIVRSEVVYDGEERFQLLRESLQESQCRYEDSLKAYGNDFGLRTLEDHDEQQNLKVRMSDLEHRLNEQLKDQDEKLASQDEKLARQGRQIEMMALTQGGYADIRKRFLENFKKDTNQGPNHAIIKSGNVVAHRGDVATDTLLYKNKQRNDFQILEQIYGLSYEKLVQIINDANLELIQVINDYGTRAVRIKVDEKGTRLTDEVRKAHQIYVDEQLNEPLTNPKDVSGGSDLGFSYWALYRAFGGR